MKEKKLPTESYKGVRDFYPRDKFVHDYILETMARVCERMGYEHYDASILEPAELYRAKGSESEEIVNNQTYTFTDRGDREVTLRPEMTPTVARMVAAKSREIAFPARWYSIPNCFRYERPQRGRLREFWQLNADIFGADGIEAEVDNIVLAYNIMKEFGADDADFEIRLNDRALLTDVFDALELTQEQRQNTMRIMDKKAKITPEEFESELREFLEDKTSDAIEKIENTHTNVRLQDLASRLSELGINNTVVDTSTVRGFNYYTGIVFEVFDTNSENNRSMFGGGRYGNLTEMFASDKITGIGFGMGDVTMQNFLESHDLLPEYTPSTDLMICVVDNTYSSKAMQLASKLREQDINTSVNFSDKKLGDQIKAADKSSIPFIIPYGEKEANTDKVVIKHLKSHSEEELDVKTVANYIFETLCER